MQGGVWLFGRLGDFYKAIKFSLEKLGKPERELKREQYDTIRENMYLETRRCLSVVANWIWQIVDIYPDFLASSY